MKALYSNSVAFLCFVSMLAALYGAFLYAPTEKTMGDVQRIFYFHVPSWWVAFLAFFVVFIASLAYLWKRDRRYDIWALASAEIGLVFTTIGLVTGPIWAKYAWGVYWTWDPRLTLALVLWLIYAAYLMLRRYIPDEEKRATLAAVTGIVGFLDVPLVFMAIRIWRTQHPQPVFMGEEGSGLQHPHMLQAFLVALAAFTFLFMWLMERRISIESAQMEIDQLHKELEAI